MCPPEYSCTMAVTEGNGNVLLPILTEEVILVSVQKDPQVLPS